jgi:hypothetical protein
MPFSIAAIGMADSNIMDDRWLLGMINEIQEGGYLFDEDWL